MKRIASFALLALLLFSGCQKSKQDVQATKTDTGIAKEWKSGPLTFTLTTDRSAITIADKLSLTLEARIDKKYTVKLPELGEKLDQFSIKDFSKKPGALVDKDTMSYKQSYVLEPFLSGDYEIPAFTVSFWTENESDPHVLESEPVSIKVGSILPENMKDIKIVGAIGPLTLPPPDLTWLFILVGAILIVGGAGGALLYLYLKKQAEKIRIITIPAHELAYRQLRKLVAKNLIEKGETKLFYYGISDIMRRYIENRFDLNASEETTEEFLASLSGWSGFSAEQKRLLKLFLEHCDLVKFANHTPSKDDIQKTFDSLKLFIYETESVEARIEDKGSEESENVISLEGL
jgi:hypothetical protein